MSYRSRRPASPKVSGPLAEPLLPYDGRQYAPEPNEVQGILGAISTYAPRYRREQQVAKLPQVVAWLGLDKGDKSLMLNLLLALCERLFPIGFNEDPRGRHKENPERKRDAAFKMLHLYQIEMLTRRRPVPSWEDSAKALRARMEGTRKNPNRPGGSGPALKAAIQEALAVGLTGGSIKRKAFDSPEKGKREKVGIEAYHLGLNNALYPLDKIARGLGNLTIFRIAECPKPNGKNARSSPLRNLTWGSALIDRLEAAGCVCTYRDHVLLGPEAHADLDAVREAYPGQNVILARDESHAKARALADAFEHMGVPIPVVTDACDELIEATGLALVLLEDGAPLALLNFYDPSAPSMGLGLLFGLTPAQIARAELWLGPTLD